MFVVIDEADHVQVDIDLADRLSDLEGDTHFDRSARLKLGLSQTGA